MITIVLTNRNRNLRTIQNCLDSLEAQSNQDFELYFVDYGSNENYVYKLEKFLQKYTWIKYINCPVSGQLWNKCRAINIVLQQCKTPYFFVGDIDMLFHPSFIEKLYKLRNENTVTYFQVGFLNEKETLQNKTFQNSSEVFKTQKDATGMTLYPTELLKSINGYDEFYHGWGAEDTDVHVRLSNLGISIHFYDQEILLKHQWHPKLYRTHLSTDPYHSSLEKINHLYSGITKKSKKVKANTSRDWGLLPNQENYLKLFSNSDFSIEVLPEASQINAVIAQLNNFEDKVLSILINDVPVAEKWKEIVKRKFGKKNLCFLPMNKVNDILLQEIISHYRNCPYHYHFDQIKKKITLKIYFQE